jgi:hypothetical protein
MRFGDLDGQFMVGLALGLLNTFQIRKPVTLNCRVVYGMKDERKHHPFHLCK